MTCKLMTAIYAGILANLLFCPLGALAYKEPTHMEMSKVAANTSALKDISATGVLHSLGLSYPIDENIKQVFPNSKTGENKSVLELIRDGANFEDSGTRALNHFFDPLTNQPLTMFGFPIFNATSPDWALEDKGDISNIGGAQKFSYKDARQSFYDALTLPTKTERDKNFGLTFETLGRVIHHIQDMAQPQHVRNDAHLDQGSLEIFGLQLNPLYNPSAYEIHTNKLNGTLPYTNADYTASTQIKFDTARKFWTTTVNGNGNTGQGMAEFTNRNFVSAGTNFTLQNGAASPSSRYKSPELNGASSIGNVATLFAAVGKPVPAGCTDVLNPCTLTFYASTVTDTLLGKTYTNERATTRSMFDEYLVASGKTITYTDPDTGQLITTDRLFALNQFNYDAAQQFLIPRAVAYSAGLINYFFRDSTSGSPA